MILYAELTNISCTRKNIFLITIAKYVFGNEKMCIWLSVKTYDRVQMFLYGLCVVTWEICFVTKANKTFNCVGTMYTSSSINRKFIEYIIIVTALTFSVSLIPHCSCTQYWKIFVLKVQMYKEI